MCHLSGIRHYSKTLEDEDEDEKKKKSKETKKEENSGGDTVFPEFFLNKNFKTTREALEIFINDNLLYEPGFYSL